MAEPLTDEELSALTHLARSPMTSAARFVLAREAEGVETPRLAREGAKRVVAVLDACARVLEELEQLRRRDREHVAGEQVLRDQVRKLERDLELVRAEK